MQRLFLVYFWNALSLWKTRNYCRIRLHTTEPEHHNMTNGSFARVLTTMGKPIANSGLGRLVRSNLPCEMRNRKAGFWNWNPQPTRSDVVKITLCNKYKRRKLN